MSSIPPRLQSVLAALERENSEFKEWLAELAQVLPSKTKRLIQHLLRLLAEDGKASPPRRGPGGLWKSGTSEPNHRPSN